MSDIANLIKQAKETNRVKGELVQITIRIPKAENGVIEELVDMLGKSKQEVCALIFKDGFMEAMKEMNAKTCDDKADNALALYYILNTNAQDGYSDQEKMVKNGTAAAFYDRKTVIEKLHTNDVVFLYESGSGIVGYGNASGETLKESRDDIEDACYYQKLNNFKILQSPLPAREVKKILGRNVVFLNTMSAVPDGEMILKAINLHI